MSCYVMSCDAMSCHVMSCHVMPCSYYLIAQDGMGWHITYRLCYTITFMSNIWNCCMYVRLAWIHHNTTQAQHKTTHTKTQYNTDTDTDSDRDREMTPHTLDSDANPATNGKRTQYKNRCIDDYVISLMLMNVMRVSCADHDHLLLLCVLLQFDVLNLLRHHRWLVHHHIILYDVASHLIMSCHVCINTHTRYILSFACHVSSCMVLYWCFTHYPHIIVIFTCLSLSSVIQVVITLR
jgi:hypothetical protein